MLFDIFLLWVPYRECLICMHKGLVGIHELMVSFEILVLFFHWDLPCIYFWNRFNIQEQWYKKRGRHTSQCIYYTFLTTWARNFLWRAEIGFRENSGTWEPIVRLWGASLQSCSPSKMTYSPLKCYEFPNALWEVGNYFPLKTKLSSCPLSNQVDALLPAQWFAWGWMPLAPSDDAQIDSPHQGMESPVQISEIWSHQFVMITGWSFLSLELIFMGLVCCISWFQSQKWFFFLFHFLGQTFL